MKKQLSLFFSLCILSSGASVAVAVAKSVSQWKGEFKRPKKVPYLEENPYSKSKDKLGKMLFFDPRLSGSKWISCATCHNPALGWEDGLKKGLGHDMEELGRHTPTVVNLAWAELLFWDGRAEHLEGQALGPIESPDEMNMNLDEMIARLKSIKGYTPLFKKAFPKDKDPIKKENVAKALAIFQRGIVSGESSFDRWIKGNRRAISKSAARGFKVFTGKANCVACHSGWSFTDHSFQDIGIDDGDEGRYKHVKIAAMKHAFKTPGLRSIAERAPYFHNGQAATLMDVINFYDRGGDSDRESKSKEVKKLGLTDAEKKDLEAFMMTLSGKDKAITIPKLPI